jgi:2-polyprenyl-3-methyl-5-hydroxy-6-metoxy-1,4-benzoquinol methylase
MEIPDYLTYWRFIDEHKSRLFFKENLKVLEIGCGEQSVLCDKRFESLSFENTAIDLKTTEFAFDPSGKNQYSQKDFFEIDPNEKFDLIIDSRFLHCLYDEQREKFWKKIKSHLNPGAHFISESIVSSKKMSFLNPFMFDQDTRTLYRSNYPLRYIPSSLELEQEILKTGHNINFFMIRPGLKMIIDDERSMGHDFDPDVAHLILTNPQ